MEELKEILGEELFTQVSEKLPEENKLMLFKKDDKVVIDNNGKWIPKEKFDDILNDKKTFKDQADNYQSELAELKKSVKDNDELTNKLTELEEQMETNKIEFGKREENSGKKYALAIQLRDEGFQYPDLLIDKFNLDDLEAEGEKIKNFDEVVKPFKEKYSNLLGKKEKSGFDPNKGKGSTEFYSREQIEAMTDEQLRDPDVLEKVNKSLSKL